VKIDSGGDPDMPLPPGDAYSAIGKSFLHISFFCIFVLKRKKNIFGWSY
jgi:hypothetical protein